MSEPNLLSLPPEILLEICSVLPSRDVNTMRLVFRAFRNAIDGKPGKAYCRRKFNVAVSAASEKLLTSYTDQDTWRCALIDFKDGLCTMARSEKPPNSLNMSNYDEFLGKSLDECHAMMVERSGGLRRLDIDDEFDLKNLHLLHNIMNQTSCLRLFCQLSSIPRDIAFQHLFSPRRSLHVTFPALIGNNNFVDDCFCQDAAAQELLVFGGEYPLIMTDDQLMTFIRREDLNYLSLYYVAGPTVEGIRNAVQALLYAKKKCMINVHIRGSKSVVIRHSSNPRGAMVPRCERHLQFLAEIMSVLLRRIDEEIISIEGEGRNTDSIEYKLNIRTVVVSHLARIEKGIKIVAE